jgi:mannose-6-phosphate isomerase-like protein (cupin superfamily)
MRAVVIGLAWIFASSAAVAQQPASGKETLYASSADVAALREKAKSIRKEGQPLVVQRILQLAPYNTNLEYRASIGPASVHEKEAELFYVIDGGGTMVTGGKLVGEKRTNAANLSGSAVEGGTPQHVSKGDFFIVPENTPHWFSSLDGSITVMSLHIPRTAGESH